MIKKLCVIREDQCWVFIFFIAELWGSEWRSEWVPSNNIDIIRYRYFRYYVGKNIYFVLLYVCLQSVCLFCLVCCKMRICRICLFLAAARVCFCLSVCVSVSCQHCWFGIRFVLFLYWYIMEEFELPWAIIFSISLLVCCSGWCSHYSVFFCVCMCECSDFICTGARVCVRETTKT